MEVQILLCSQHTDHDGGLARGYSLGSGNTDQDLRKAKLYFWLLQRWKKLLYSHLYCIEESGLCLETGCLLWITSSPCQPCSDNITSLSWSFFLEFLEFLNIKLEQSAVCGSDLNVFSVMWQPGQELLSSHQFPKQLRAFFQMLDEWSDVVVHRLCMDLRKTQTWGTAVRKKSANQPPRCPLLAAGLISGTPGWT